MDDTFVFSCPCDEPEGTIERKVNRLIFYPANVQKFWDKAKQFPTIYGREIKSVEDFYNLFVQQNGEELNLNGLFWVIDDFVGVFYMTEITSTEANVHYSFFDGRHKGRVQLVKKMIQHIFDKYKFRRINVEVPLYSSKYTRFFVTNLGFALEGRKRKAAFYKGQWFDVLQYGMISEEAYGRAEG